MTWIIVLLVLYLLLDLWRAWLTIICNRGIAKNNKMINEANIRQMERMEQSALIMRQADEEIDVLKGMVREMASFNKLVQRENIS